MSNLPADLVTRLRSRAWEDRQHRELRAQAADEIERLRERNAWLENYVKACDNEIKRARSASTRRDES